MQSDEVLIRLMVLLYGNVLDLSAKLDAANARVRELEAAQQQPPKPLKKK